MQERYLNFSQEETPYRPRRTAPRRRRRSRFYKPTLWLLFIPVAIFYCEILLRAFTSAPVFFGFFTLLGFSFAAGFLLDIVCFMLTNEKTKSTIRWIVMILFSFAFTLEYFMYNSYRAFMDLKSIISGAGGVVGEFSDVIGLAIVSGLPKIFLFFLPVIIMLVVKLLRVRMAITPQQQKRFNGGGTLVVGCFALISFLVAFVFMLGSSALRESYFDYHGFDESVRSFGLVTATRLDIKNAIFGGKEAETADFVTEQQPTGTDKTGTASQTGTADGPGEGEQTPEVVAPKVYGYNKMDYDFDALIAAAPSKEVANVHSYVAGVTPSIQSDYTGLFKGKNLIFFTAEAFAAEVIDKDLTPTLYRLAHKGFDFTDYYQPAWGGSTSTGEYSLLTGLVPTSGVKSMKATIGHDLSFTIAHKLKKEGYFTAAYHNGEYTYYGRNQTHENFGYDSFTAMGNGMENGVKKTWPESDLEMMQYTLPLYSGKDKFCVYYMTISGHCLYSTAGNRMAAKNFDKVSHLPYSDKVKGYLAANLELEYALEYTVKYLEDNGLADDTVIVLSTDHYPYGLEKSDSWGNDQDYLEELYGYPADSNTARDHSALIIWSGCLEHEDRAMACTIDTPTYSLDVLPTLCNLFGVEYDSRTLIGRDVFASNQEPLVIWTNRSWLTDKGYYNAANGSFTPADGAGEVSDEYIQNIKNIVKNKVSYSKSVLSTDYFKSLKK